MTFLTQINFAQPRLIYLSTGDGPFRGGGRSPFLKKLRPPGAALFSCDSPDVSMIMIPLKLIFCVTAALFAAVTVISAQRRDAAATISCAVITGLSLIAMEWA